MPRPYLQSTTEELRKLYLEGQQDRALLQAILGELSHRKRPAAAKLRAEIEAVLHGNGNAESKAPAAEPRKRTPRTPEVSADAAPAQPLDRRGATARRRPAPAKPQARAAGAEKDAPAGTKRPAAAPDDQVPFEESDDVVRNFARALEVEVAEIRKNGSQATIGLSGGTRVRQEGDHVLYRFPPIEARGLQDDAQIILRIGRSDAIGTVASITPDATLIALDEDFGPYIAQAALRIDQSFLVDRVRERMAAIAENPGTFNLTLGRKVLGLEPGAVDQDLAVEIPAAEPVLSSEQAAAVRQALGSEVTYLWGPPGTGKSTTAAVIARGVFRRGERLLVVSNTNLAVDLLLEEICGRLADTPEFERGAVLRIGTLSDKFPAKYADRVQIDQVVERLGAELTVERDRLRDELGTLEQQAEPLRATLRLFDERAAVASQQAQAETDLDAARAHLMDAREKLTALRQERSELEGALPAAEAAGALRRLLPGRNPERIRRRLTELTTELPAAETAARTAEAEIPRLGALRDALERRAAELARATVGQDAARLRSELQAITTRMEPLQTRLREIDQTLADLRAEVLGNCRVLAATASQVFLKPAEFTTFDAVLVDEASMLPLPQVFGCVGLATRQAIVTGDFRQLPPIVLSKHPAVAKWVGRDVFSAAGITDAVNSRATPPALAALREQRRMVEPICELINQPFYGGTLRTHREAGPKAGRAAAPAPFDAPLTLIDTSSEVPFSSVKAGTYSRYNVLHAIAVRNIWHHLRGYGYMDGQETAAAVITPFSAQAELIGQLVQEVHDADRRHVGTVHRFQGQGRDLIILDLTDSHGGWGVSHFIRSTSLDEAGAKLLNVALSRAKGHLVVLANLDYLRSRLAPESFVAQLLGTLQARGRVVDVQDVLRLGPGLHLPPTSQATTLPFEYAPGEVTHFTEDSFDRAFLQDVGRAARSIVIYSAFCTPQRCGRWEMAFRAALGRGVRIRVVTRPPTTQGSIAEDAVLDAIRGLQRLGVVVDLRGQIHEKAVFIDGGVLWYGSLNVMSHTGSTDESMMRFASASACAAVGELFTLPRMAGRGSDHDLTAQENPTCQGCGSLSVFYRSKKTGSAFFKCLEACGWSQSLDRPVRAAGAVEGVAPPPRSCPACGRPLRVRSGKRGPFYGCSGYPECRHTEPAARREAASSGARSSS